MRNLNQYPITDQEIIETLEAMIEEIISKDTKDLRVGNMRPAILREVLNRIKPNN